MQNTTPSAGPEGRPISATLTSKRRITPAKSPEDVMQLKFVTDDASFDVRLGQCIRIRAPGQFGQRYHERLYQIADLDRSDPQRTEFELLVRRWNYIDEFNGERYAGVASNFLCDLATGGTIEFTGPVGHPFDAPATGDENLLMIGMGTGIAPFRGLIRRIYETAGKWRGQVRLFYGARSGLEMLYMNDQNADIANYYDEATFKAFKAVSPRPAFEAPPAIEQAIAAHATEVWNLLSDPKTHLFIAGPKALLDRVEAALTEVAGSPAAWQEQRAQLVASGRWHEMLY